MRFFSFFKPLWEHQTEKSVVQVIQAYGIALKVIIFEKVKNWLRKIKNSRKNLKFTFPVKEHPGDLVIEVPDECYEQFMDHTVV